MTNLEVIKFKIKEKNQSHFDKLNENLFHLGEEYTFLADNFFEKYFKYLEINNLKLDFSIDCYLHMIDDMLEERFNFIRTGNYSNTSFEEVEKRIYGNPNIMDYHMHGLVLAQFLWFDQYERISFFVKNLKKYFLNKKYYLEIGGGHGLYINEAVNLLPLKTQFDLVDISQSSINLAVGILNNTSINYFLKDIFDFTETNKYDFITMGEVLEHVEKPLELLQKAASLLNENGVFYLTTPVNAPMIDHIYLFNNVDEIKNLIKLSGFEIIEDCTVISEKMTPAQAAKFKVPVMYAAFLKKLIKTK